MNIEARTEYFFVGLSALGLITGYVLNKAKGRYKNLTIIHGIFNTVLLVLVLINFCSGISLAKSFLF